ncbi:MAG: hypothetical protein IT436_09680 [Phycisphaerales bacterium]|nr:hypothetical protein [Phycisphaerales bacterium]
MRSLVTLLLPLLMAAPGLAQTENPTSAPAPLPESHAYKAGPGPFEVTSTDLKLRDDARKKDLPLRILAPKPTIDQPGPFPLILFSHGLGGSRDAFPDLTRHWCSHGYVVILPTHIDSIQQRREDGEDLSHLRRDIKALEKDSNPLDRIADVGFILDSLDDLESRVEPLRAADKKPLIDRDRIGMAGHSAGAFTTQMVFGVKLKSLLAMRSFADPRIDAAILISGQGTNRRALTKDSWADINKPMMVITGSKDTARIGNETPATRQDPYRYAPPGDKYLIFIDGATHSSYTGQARAMGLDPDRPDADTLKMVGQVTASGTLAFWDAYLNAAGPARAYLSGDDLPELSGRKARLDRK